VGQEANARLEQLESSVANLLAGLAGGTGPGVQSGSYPNTEILHSFEPGSAVSERRRSRDKERDIDTPGHRWNNILPPPTHIRPVDPPRFGPNPLQPSLSPDDISSTHVRFDQSPGGAKGVFIPYGTSPSAYTSSGLGISPRDGEGKERKGKGKGQNAEERLAAMTGDQGFEPPFTALLHQVSIEIHIMTWLIVLDGSLRLGIIRSNRGAARGMEAQVGHSLETRLAGMERMIGGSGERRMTRSMLDLSTSQWRRFSSVCTYSVVSRHPKTDFLSFIDHCHPFMPIVNVALDDAFTTIRRSPPLISTMIAIAARFYILFTARNPRAGSMSLYPPLDPTIPSKLANLAESHLAQTLLRRQHALSDVQTILLLAAWGLHSGGRGPDAWIVTGHAARVARRLGVHRILAQAAEEARMAEPESEEWDKLEAFMPQWRTW
jgi:hypothetical protein